MPDSCLMFHILGNFQLQKLQPFPRNKLRKVYGFAHQKFSLGQDLLITSEYSKGKSGKKIKIKKKDCTLCGLYTVILCNIDNFGDTIVCLQLPEYEKSLE